MRRKKLEGSGYEIGHWTIKLGIQTDGLNKCFQSLVFVLTQLHFGQWSSLPFCLVKLAYTYKHNVQIVGGGVGNEGYGGRGEGGGGVGLGANVRNMN